MKVLLTMILLFVFTLKPNSGMDMETIDTESVVVYDTIKVESYQPVYTDVIGTVYHPVEKQCDDTPLITADHSKIDIKNVNKLRWIALSRDLIDHQDSIRKWYGEVKFGDTVLVESNNPEINGLWVVHDTMNKRYTNRMDFLQNPDGIYGRWENITIKRKVVETKVIPKSIG